jgi:hypothetical protein
VDKFIKKTDLGHFIGELVGFDGEIGVYLGGFLIGNIKYSL